MTFTKTALIPNNSFLRGDEFEMEEWTNLEVDEMEQDARSSSRTRLARIAARHIMAGNDGAQRRPTSLPPVTDDISSKPKHLQRNPEPSRHTISPMILMLPLLLVWLNNCQHHQTAIISTAVARCLSAGVLALLFDVFKTVIIKQEGYPRDPGSRLSRILPLTMQVLSVLLVVDCMRLDPGKVHELTRYDHQRRFWEFW